MADATALYAELVDHLRKTALLQSTGSVLGWDEQTYLPTGGAEHRANQLSLISGLTHEHRTAPRIGELLGELEQLDLGPEDGPMAVNVREARRDYDRSTKLPKTLVEEISRVTSLAHQAWIEARKQKDFPQFQPWLERVVSLKREEAEALGFDEGGVPYDALLDQYEPGAKSSEVTKAFAALRDELVPLVAAIRESPKKPDSGIITRYYPKEAQRRFGIAAATHIGFRFDEGRLDEAAHPFCSGFGPGDCRLTTRYDERHFNGAFFGTLHEAGHGMYEQGLNHELYGTPMGDSVSLGIHESQSRMWENFVGRSRAFWEHFYSPAQRAFPEALGDVSLEDFHFAINDVEPSYIRVEADEVTYNLHIMLRFEMEQPLIAGDLTPADVPGVWNEKFQQFFGLTPPDDALGCLQDIHWSAGLIGYFPTYALGNMYAAHFYNAAEKELGSLKAMFAKGEFGRLLAWLNKNIHQRGRQYPATELVRVVTGESLSHKPLMAHLHAKYDALYGL